MEKAVEHKRTLKNTKQPKSVSDMRLEEIYDEIVSAGYRIEQIFTPGRWVALSLRKSPGLITTQVSTETTREFYIRCLEYVRKNRP